MSIFDAVAANDVSLLSSLLASGHSPNTSSDTSPFHYPLHTACMSGSLEAAEVLLSAGANPLVRDIAGTSPFSWAVSSGRLDFIELYMQHIAPAPKQRGKKKKKKKAQQPAPPQPNAPPHPNSKLLEEACALGHEDIVRALLRWKPPTLEFAFALLSAAHRGRLEIVKILLHAGARVDAAHPRTRHTALMRAVQGTHLDVLQFLLDKSADINARDAGGWTPLIHAANRGSVDVAELLVERGAKLNLMTVSGYTALTTAVSKDHTDFVRALCKAGAHPGKVDQSRRVPVAVAAQSGAVASLRVLCDFGADVNETGSDLNTPLHHAALHGSAESIKVLLAHGAELDAVGNEQMTPLMLACYNNKVGAVGALLEAGASLRGALNWATSPSRLDPVVIRLLLDHGADVNATFNKSTPLLRAVRSFVGGPARLEATRILLEAGADCWLLSPASVAEGPLLALLHVYMFKQQRLTLLMGLRVGDPASCPLRRMAMSSHFEPQTFREVFALAQTIPTTNDDVSEVEGSSDEDL